MSAEIIALCKKELLDIYSHAIGAVRPDRLIKEALNFNKEDQVLTITRDHIGTNAASTDLVRFNLKGSNLHVVGGGKSVLGMALGLAELVAKTKFSKQFSFGTLSLPIGLASIGGQQNLLSSIGIECLFGSRDNLPDESSVLASKSILDRIKLACEQDRSLNKRPLFIVLLSGGGSACLTSPRYIEIEEKLRIIKFLVQSGANIVELNKVRRYFSQIKGGQLVTYILKHNPESQILSLIMSDVIDDPIEFIASGPTFVPMNVEQDNLKFDSMMDVLNKYNFPDVGKLLCYGDFIESKSLSFNKDLVINQIIGNNTIALKAAKDRARLLGYTKIECLGNDLQGFSDQVVEKICRAGDELARGEMNEDGDKILVLGGGETTINKLQGETWGLGGRAQEMALDYMIYRMSRTNCDNANREWPLVDVFLAGGTDGQDGPTDVAACLASYKEWLEDGHSCEIDHKRFTLSDIKRAKSSHDSCNFWKKNRLSWLVQTGLTGTNVMDLYLYGLLVDKANKK